LLLPTRTGDEIAITHFFGIGISNKQIPSSFQGEGIFSVPNKVIKLERTLDEVSPFLASPIHITKPASNNKSSLLGVNM
jgi:hypothetical protein